MASSAGVSIYQLTRDDAALLQSLLLVFGEAFGEELQKFEQERSEIYIYDLAVAVTH
jgi:hypothetical protein